ncbi:MAG: DUF1156 domain-containing protein [Verrucomicrobia bacterium]|nr:DUF1156 domain-containing protein [Verrucomicrobiota bacterium]
MPGIGAHPKGIHHWWARLPLPTARAVLFASVVDDPTSDPRFADKSEEEQDAERERLFGIIRRLMTKKMHEHPEIYAEALKEMKRCCDGKLPEVLDPFAGGGSIPLEAHRMGFKAHASDLNPVAVLINKACLEIVPRWLNHPPVHPEARKDHVTQDHWRGASGLAEDVRRYGADILKQAKEKIGHLYPKAKLPKELGGGEDEVIAWIWARTVASPNPIAKGAHVPLLSTYWLSTKGDGHWLSPEVDKETNTYSFKVMSGPPPDPKAVRAGTKTGRGARFECLLTGASIDEEHLQAEGKAGRIGSRLVAIVTSSGRGRVYLPAQDEHQNLVEGIVKPDEPTEELAHDPRNIWCKNYGLTEFRDLFSPRQLVTQLHIADMIKGIEAIICSNAHQAGLNDDDARSYACSIRLFLGFALDRCADFNCGLSTWKPSGEQQMHLFGRQAIPMVWDYTEANVLGNRAICWHNATHICADAIETIPAHSQLAGCARQQDATKIDPNLNGKLLVSTDPPYYDNISYAGLSDFFYVWLRRTLGDIQRDLFGTMLVPKMEELTAAPERYNGNKLAAKDHFESGFREAFDRFRQAMDPRFPLTVYYAFKQSDEEAGKEDDDDEKVTLTTGWETLLEALITSGFQITATWPVRASQQWRMRAMGSNALASYIVLACRSRDPDAPSATRHNFRQALQRELPDAVRKLQFANIAPVDLAQASIGPGMAIYSKYSKVIEADGDRLSVRTALQLINQVLGETLDEQENDFDSDTRWAVTWFRQHGYEEGPYGSAEELAVAQAISVQGLVEGGILFAKGGKARLLRNEELQAEWNPETDSRISIWECTAHLVRALRQGGESRAANLLAAIHRRSGLMPPAIKELAYLMFQTCEKKGWAKDALGFNALVTSWPAIEQASQDVPKPRSDQGELDL